MFRKIGLLACAFCILASGPLFVTNASATDADSAESSNPDTPAPEDADSAADSSNTSTSPSARASDESEQLVVSINPSEQDLELKPGRSHDASVTVYNVGKIPFEFEVEAAPYQNANDAYDPDFASENNYTKLKNWIYFPEKHFSVEPDHAVEVKFQVNVPKDVVGGGQYAAIIIRTIDPNADAGAPVQLVAQLASILYGHVEGGEKQESGELVKYSLPSLMLGSEFKSTAIFKNTGNVDFRVTETMSIRDLFTNREIMNPASASETGQPIGTIESTVLPGTSRTINMHWAGAPQLGFFRVTQTISYLDQDQTIEKIVFICPIWLLILVAVFVLVAIVWIITIIHNRRRKRPQVF